MFYVYILWSERLKKRYIGSTGDLDKRLYEHNKGKNRFTKGGMPWVLIYKEAYFDLSTARKREIFLKSGVGRAWLDKQYPQYSKVRELN